MPIAASIFLDVFNIFLFFLALFGGGGSRVAADQTVMWTLPLLRAGGERRWLTESLR